MCPAERCWEWRLAAPSASGGAAVVEVAPLPRDREVRGVVEQEVAEVEVMLCSMVFTQSPPRAELHLASPLRWSILFIY